MGYTHYWRSTTIPEKIWTDICDDVRRLFDAERDFEIAVDYDLPEEPPIITDTMIRFNGVGDEGHETFLFSRTASKFEFCKTAYKPYDRMVCAVLLVINHHAEDLVEISSDGGPEDWHGAQIFASSVLLRSLKLPKRVEG